MEILVTGFEPWGPNRSNPSGDVAAALGGRVLPVDFLRAERKLLRLLRRMRPDALVMLGLAASRRKISLESLAWNRDAIPESGLQPIRKRGPEKLPTRLPLERLRARLRRAGIPVELSGSAGSFVCNHVFYVALSVWKGPCGFIHVPPVRAIPLEKQVKAVRLVLETLRTGGA